MDRSDVFASRRRRMDDDDEREANIAARIADPDHPDGPVTVDEFRELLNPKGNR